MHSWFWAWVIVGVVVAAVSVVMRDPFSAPWAAGAFAAAALEALGAAPAWQWLAFLAASSIVFVALNRRPRYVARHRRRKADSPAAGDTPDPRLTPDKPVVPDGPDTPDRPDTPGQPE